MYNIYLHNTDAKIFFSHIIMIIAKMKNNKNERNISEKVGKKESEVKMIRSFV